jgi:putative sterol carrier protein
MARIDLENSSPAQIYEAISTMDEDEFDDLMETPESRDKIISALVEHMASLFRPEKAGDLEATIHIKLWDKPGGGYDHFELRIEDGTCFMRDPDNEPDLTLKVRPSDLRKLVTGETGARRLAFKGRLRAIGDLGLGMKMPDLFAF